MVIPILCILVGGYIGFIIALKDYKDEKIGKILETIAGMLAGAFCSLLLIGLFTWIIPHASMEVEYESPTQLVALAGSSTEMNGSFFLASGDINSEQYYHFYYQLADGGKKFGKILAKNAIVYEEDRKNAYMVKKGKQDKYSSSVYLWVIPKFMCRVESIGLYAIHVPKGTIKEGYNIGLR